MDIPYIDFPGGPLESVPVAPEPVADGPSGTMFSVTGNPDASVLIAMFGLYEYYPLISYDFGASWELVGGVKLGNNEDTTQPVDVWFDHAEGHFVATGLLEVEDYADVDGVGFAYWREEENPPKWMTSTDGVLWKGQAGDAPIGPGRAGGRVHTEVPGGFLSAVWPFYSGFAADIPFFSVDGVDWVPVNVPPTVIEGSYTEVFEQGFMGRVAALPGGRHYITGAGQDREWHGVVEFHFGIPVVPPFWTNHVNTVEYI